MTLITENLIEVNADLIDKEQVINTIANLLEKDDRLVDRDIYVKDVFAREEESPTALGFSFAIPHAKSDGVKAVSLVFIELENEIMWTDSEKIKYVFGIAVPSDQAGNEHLQILSMLARKMIKDEFKEGLKNAKSKKDYLSLIMAD
jgi:fructose-specific phosphotransferase system IIA component